MSSYEYAAQVLAEYILENRCTNCKNYLDDILEIGMDCTKIIGPRKRIEGIVKYGYDCFERNEDGHSKQEESK